MHSAVGRAALGGALLLGAIGVVRAQDFSASYSEALQDFKTSNYDQGLTAIDQAEKDRPGDVPTEILKARILTELRQFDEAHQTLQSLDGRSDLTPAYHDGLLLAKGDLGLRERRFDDASKAYDALLETKPNDPDVLLRDVYARVGANDLVTAAKYSSRLKPLDPVNPAYYFAKAALAEATGQGADADQNIETVRTIYGLTVANRYLRLYYELFSSPSPGGASPAEPAKTASP
jgi:tetratricopeptide (TPR) repeat protein